MPEERAPVAPAAPDLPEDLESADVPSLVDTELDGVLIDGAALAGANASGAVIGESRIADTDLDGANLTRSIVHDVLFARGSLANARLEDLQIRRTRFEGVAPRV